MKMLSFFCRTCGSPRPDRTCWKCQSPTILPAKQWRNPRCPNIEAIQLLGRQMGYSIAVHGSQERDLDLIAVPWIWWAEPIEVLIDHLCKSLRARQAGGIEAKPHGRLAVILQIDGYYKPIDLSIIPPACV